MRQLPEPTGPRFLKVETFVYRLVCRSRVEHWLAHFDPVTRMPYRCEGEGCKFCDSGRVPELRFVLGVWSERTGRALLELRERHRQVLEAMASEELEGIGARLRVWRSGSAKNSPIEVELEGFEESDEWDISRLVLSLGLTQSRKSPNCIEDASQLNGQLSKTRKQTRKTLVGDHDTIAVPVHENGNTKALVPSGTS